MSISKVEFENEARHVYIIRRAGGNNLKVFGNINSALDYVMSSPHEDLVMEIRPVTDSPTSDSLALLNDMED